MKEFKEKANDFHVTQSIIKIETINEQMLYEGTANDQSIVKVADTLDRMQSN